MVGPLMTDSESPVSELFLLMYDRTWTDDASDLRAAVFVDVIR